MPKTIIRIPSEEEPRDKIFDVCTLSNPPNYIPPFKEILYRPKVA